jgi:hypothetical protein
MVGFEGKMFFKNSNDGNFNFSYNFCGALFCDDFGNALAVPVPNSVNGKVKNDNDVNLNSNKEGSFN